VRVCVRVCVRVRVCMCVFLGIIGELPSLCLLRLRGVQEMCVIMMISRCLCLHHALFCTYTLAHLPLLTSALW
jgi:hypothetical protein